MHFSVPDPMIFGPLKIHRRLKRSQRKCPYRRHPRAAEQGEALVAVHGSREHGAAPEAGVLEPEQVALGAYANLMLRKLPGSRLEAFQSALVKPAPALLLCPHTQTQNLILCLLPDSPSHRKFLGLLILPKGYLLALHRRVPYL